MRLPAYSHHKATDQAYVRLNGKFVYLGKFGTDESRRKYEQVVGIWLSNDRQLPDSPSKTNESSITVGLLYEMYLEHCRGYYQRDGKPTQEYESHVYLKSKIKSILNMPVNSVSPATINGMRKTWIEAGNSRKYVNKTVGRITRMYRWGVEKECVGVQVWQKLKAVAGLKAGRSEAKDRSPVKPADDIAFDLACGSMPDHVSALARIQRLCGCRPGELWIMRPADIDRSGDVWTYTPASHKTEHHGKQRRIYFGPKAQALLLPYLLRPAYELCFTRSNGRKWDRFSWCAAIHLACKYAGVEKINPNQLRHSAGTEIRQRYGLEGAQVALGHASASVTEIYAETDKSKAVLIAKEIG